MGKPPVRGVDKATGAMAANFPKQGNAIWAGFADAACANNNDGDPIGSTTKRQTAGY